MIYGTQDLLTEERNACQRGDHTLAEALGVAIDFDAADTRVRDLECVLDDLRAAITEANWRTDMKAELRELVQCISVKLAEAVE